ncbi:MAG: hypothetical protein LUF28_04125 [Clostridiales bacterium]|nr:hypothetical protein [Clostridiales bacterium]
MYEKHKMDVIAFDSVDVFADLSIASDADENGGGTTLHSVNPYSSDK